MWTAGLGEVGINFRKSLRRVTIAHVQTHAVFPTNGGDPLLD